MPDARAQVADIYRRHGASVYRRARSLLGNDAEASEVLQDVFVSLLERPDQFRGASEMGTFLYSATTHACLNRLRNQRNRARLLDERAPSQPPQVPPPPDVGVRLRDALERLPPPLAEVAVYYFVDELSQSEIAAILGCSRSQFGVLVQRIEARGKAQEQACPSR